MTVANSPELVTDNSPVTRANLERDRPAMLSLSPNEGSLDFRASEVTANIVGTRAVPARGASTTTISQLDVGGPRGVGCGQSGETIVMSGGVLDAGFPEYVNPGRIDRGPLWRLINVTHSWRPAVVEQDKAVIRSSCTVRARAMKHRSSGHNAQALGPSTKATHATPGSATARPAICVIEAEPGKYCVQICRAGDDSFCPPGLTCGNLDIEGFGACS